MPDLEARPEQEQEETRPMSMSEDCDMEAPAPERKAQNITIHPLNYGYNVKVGCQVFAVETVEKLIKNIKAYLEDPQTTERKWTDNNELL